MVSYGKTSKYLTFYLECFAWVIFGILLEVFTMTEAEFMMYDVFQNWWVFFLNLADSLESRGQRAWGSYISTQTLHGEGYGEEPIS